MKKIIILVAMIFVLAACGEGDSYGNRNYNNNVRNDYYSDYYYNDYYMDAYELLVADISHLSIYDIEDIAEMIVIAWEHFAYVEVDYNDYYGVDTEEIYNEQQLENFLAEIYYNEVYVVDVEVMEDNNNLILLFTVDVN